MILVKKKKGKEKGKKKKNQIMGNTLLSITACLHINNIDKICNMQIALLYF